MRRRRPRLRVQRRPMVQRIRTSPVRRVTRPPAMRRANPRFRRSSCHRRHRIRPRCPFRSFDRSTNPLQTALRRFGRRPHRTQPRPPRRCAIHGVRPRRRRPRGGRQRHPLRRRLRLRHCRARTRPLRRAAMPRRGPRPKRNRRKPQTARRAASFSTAGSALPEQSCCCRSALSYAGGPTNRHAADPYTQSVQPTLRRIQPFGFR